MPSTPSGQEGIWRCLLRQNNAGGPGTPSGQESGTTGPLRQNNAAGPSKQVSASGDAEGARRSRYSCRRNSLPHNGSTETANAAALEDLLEIRVRQHHNLISTSSDGSPICEPSPHRQAKASRRKHLEFALRKYTRLTCGTSRQKHLKTSTA